MDFLIFYTLMGIFRKIYHNLLIYQLFLIQETVMFYMSWYSLTKLIWGNPFSIFNSIDL